MVLFKQPLRKNLSIDVMKGNVLPTRYCLGQDGSYFLIKRFMLSRDSGNVLTKLQKFDLPSPTTNDQFDIR